MAANRGDLALAALARALGATSYHVCGGPGSLDECIHEHQPQWERRTRYEREGRQLVPVDAWWCPICRRVRA